MVMRHVWTRCCTSRSIREDLAFDLTKSTLPIEFTNCFDDIRSKMKSLHSARIRDKIKMSFSIFWLFISQSMKFLRQWTKCFSEKLEFWNVESQLSLVCTKHLTSYTDKITKIKTFFKDLKRSNFVSIFRKWFLNSIFCYDPTSILGYHTLKMTAFILKMKEEDLSKASRENNTTSRTHKFFWGYYHLFNISKNWFIIGYICELISLWKGAWIDRNSEIFETF